MKRFYVACVLCMGVILPAWTQNIVSGTVFSAEDDGPLPGVSVLVKGTTTGTITDFEGNFTLEVSNPQEATLVLSQVGYKTTEIAVNNRSQINITMETEVTELTEVIVVGYGTQKRKDVTGAISTIEEGDIANVPAAYSFEDAIQGKAAGMNVALPSATPGAAINVNIRGVTSIDASSQPLYVIDGIPVVARNNSALNSNIQPVNPLADINPNDIESISILKDASAAAIYGSRGANGVIIITTKRGKAGKTRFNAGYYAGFSEIANTPDLMNSSQWINFLNAAAEFDGLGENFWNDVLGDPNDPNLRNVNAYDQIFRTGITHNADLSLQGGSDKTKFYLSGNYYNQTGIQVGQAFERASVRTNIDHNINPSVTVGGNLLLSRTDHERTINENDEYGVVVNAQAWDPTAPLFEEDGSYSNPFDYYGWWALENPMFIAEQYLNNSLTNRVLGSTYLTWDIVEGLSFKTTWSVDYNTLIDESFTPAGGNETPVGEGIYATWEEFAWLSENTLTYTTEVGEGHMIEILAGATWQESNITFSEVTGNGFPSNQITQLASAANTSGESNATAFGFQSFLGRVNYNFNDRYLLTFNARADGSSRFGSNNRYGIFPSGSVGWRISNEPFMEGLRSTISNLKLRASYGTTGNAEIGNFTWRGAYSLESAYNGAGGSSPAILENPDLGWERTTQLDIGLDLGLFDQRVRFTFDYFKKNTTDLLLETDIPGTTGFRDVTDNFGEIENRGVEFSLGGDVISGDQFSWTLSGNYTYLENEVIDVVNNGQVISRNFIILEGEPLSQLNLIEFLGVDPLTGDAIFEDFNGDGIINLDDRQPVGSGIPTYYGGITNTFRYRGFSLDVFIQFSGGNDIFNQSRHAYENYGSLRSGIPYGNQHVRSLNYWRQPGDITDIPRPSHAEPSDPAAQWQRFSTMYLESGNFVRLKNVRLAYDFPAEWIEDIGLSNARIYVQGRNLITWTDYLGFDPEVSTNTDSQGNLNSQQGEDFGTLGQARTYTIGFNLGF